MVKLGVNIDHVATLRQARRTYEPDPVFAAHEAVLGGADGITVHLREDRRHIQDRDVRILRQTTPVKLNLEMALSEEIIGIALEVKPEQVTLVPERRQEVTTEGGLDLSKVEKAAAKTIERFRKAGILVSLFIDPAPRQVELAAALKADAVELHTGSYANAKADRDVESTFGELVQALRLGRKLGLTVHAGHGLNYRNVRRPAAVEGFDEFNIGHAIVSRAVFVGLRQAVQEMKQLLQIEDCKVQTAK
jgi:pyridoxine 5-phosphate synthase